MKYLKVIILTWSFVVIGCKSDINDAWEDMPKTEFTEMDSVFLSNEYEFKEGNPATMHALDSTLIIHSFDSDHVFYNYNINNKKLSAGYINFGRGPNEMSGPISSGITDDKLWVYDIVLKKIFTLDTKSFPNINKLETTLHSFPVKDNYYKISLLDSLHFLASGGEDDSNKVIKMDLSKDQVVEGYGEIKLIDSPEEKAFRKADQKFIFANGAQNKAVIAYRFSDKLEIMDSKTENFKVIKGMDGFKADFTLVKNTADEYAMVENQETRRAFTEGFVSDSYIYLAFSGRKSVDPESYNSDTILIYDWNGDPVKKIKLDRRILNFTVSQDKYFYAFDPHNGYIVKGVI